METLHGRSLKNDHNRPRGGAEGPPAGVRVERQVRRAAFEAHGATQ
jgi:hypothetical protein